MIFYQSHHNKLVLISAVHILDVSPCYGDDSRIRSELVDHAIQRFGKPIAREDIYLIGDTPLDIRAARDASVNAIGVATGVYKSTDLKDADLVLESFNEEKKLFEFLKI